MKALVLGGQTGLVGQALTEVLRNAHWEVKTTTRADVDFVAPDASARLASVLDTFEPHCVFNTVAYTQVDAAEDDEDGATLLNRTAPAIIGRLLRTRPCKLVHLSTDFVFSGRKKSPYPTDATPDPLSVYGKTKLAGEEVILSLDLKETCIVRTAWLFGPGRGNFVRTILSRCTEKKPLNIIHDQIGSPTYTIDLAQYILKLVEANASGIFHVVNSGQASWCELAAEAVLLAQLECTVNAIPSSAYPQRAIRPTYSVLDTKCLTHATDITPRPWPQALREYIFREFPPKGDSEE